MTDLASAGRLDYLDLFAAERAELLKFLEGLDQPDWGLRTECPSWSVKGIALHLLGDDLSILSRQRDGEPSRVAIESGSNWDEFFVTLDRHNEEWVEAASFTSVRLLLDQLRLSGEETERWYATIEADLLGEPIPWIGPDPAPYWLLCAREYLERWIHHSQIRRAVGGAAWFDEKWVFPAVEVAVRGFPAGLAALPAQPGSTVTVGVGGGPAWTLQKDDDHWHLYEGAVTDPNVALVLDAPTAAQLFSRALTKDELAGRLKPSGDEELCQLFALGLTAFFGR